MRIFGISLVLLSCVTSSALGVTIPTVPIGNAGNAPDPLTGNFFGSVTYNYRMGTTEVTNAQYVEFLNAVAATDEYGLYKSDMGRSLVGGITRTGSPGSYSYSVKADAGFYTYANKPVVYVSWGDAVRFSNWLHNGQPSGVQDASTTEDGAYTINGATSNSALNAVTRNSGATWFLPTEDEWYKAAYYYGDAGIYYRYATSSNIEPTNNLVALDDGNSANFRGLNGYATGDFRYPLTDVGSYSLSASPYGTYDQGGNVRERNEFFDGVGGRGIRGGEFEDITAYLRSSDRYISDPTSENDHSGFRVATVEVPEPSTYALGALALAALLLSRRFKRT